MYFTSDFTSFDHVFILSNDINVDGTYSVIYQTDLNVNSLQKENNSLINRRINIMCIVWMLITFFQ